MPSQQRVSIMNRAATEDLRTIEVVIIRRVLNGGPAPSKLGPSDGPINQWRRRSQPDTASTTPGSTPRRGAVMDTA
jgi:hypothetical protein